MEKQNIIGKVGVLITMMIVEKLYVVWVICLAFAGCLVILTVLALQNHVIIQH